MKSCAGYVADSKAKLGNPRMSDRELGEHLGYIQQNIARAKSGLMTDPLAIKISQLLKIDAGEVLLVARAEREKEGPVKVALLAYAKKVLASVPTKVASAVSAMALGLGLMLLPAPETQAATVYGGKGRFRPRVA